MAALFDTPRKRPQEFSPPPPMAPSPDTKSDDSDGSRIRRLSRILVRAEPFTFSETDRRAMIDRMIDRSEGRGLVDNPGDLGGPTFSGISQNYGLAEWNRTHPDRRIGHVLELNDTPDRVYEIYDTLYLREPKIDQIAAPLLRENTFDAAVNQGTRGAVEMLQRAMRDAGLDVEIDGYLGPKTLGRLNALTDREGSAVDAASAAKLKEIAHRLVEQRRDRYDDRIAKDPRKAVYRAGWYKRAESFRPND